jgi:hypothetical protein
LTPHVLARNPEVSDPAQDEGLIPTSWDPFSFWMGENFAFSRSFSSTTPSALSPFFLLEARASFLLSLLDLNSDTFLAGTSELSSLLFFLRSKAVVHATTSFESHLGEYTQKVPRKISETQLFSQMVIWDQPETVSLSRLTPHGRVYLASTHSLPLVPAGFSLEESFSYEKDSEIGLFYLLQVIR